MTAENCRAWILISLFIYQHDDKPTAFIISIDKKYKKKTQNGC